MKTKISKKLRQEILFLHRRTLLSARDIYRLYKGVVSDISIREIVFGYQKKPPTPAQKERKLEYDRARHKTLEYRERKREVDRRYRLRKKAQLRRANKRSN